MKTLQAPCLWNICLSIQLWHSFPTLNIIPSIALPVPQQRACVSCTVVAFADKEMHFLLPSYSLSGIISGMPYCIWNDKHFLLSYICETLFSLLSKKPTSREASEHCHYSRGILKSFTLSVTTHLGSQNFVFLILNF